jgi:hypothetical protein
LLHVQIGKLESSQCVFEVAPDSLNWIQLGTLGWQEHEAHVGREREPLGGMHAIIVQEQEIQAVREGHREGADEDLKALGVQIRQLQKEALPADRLHGAIDIEPLELYDRPSGDLSMRQGVTRLIDLVQRVASSHQSIQW